MAQTQDFPDNPFALRDLTVADYLRLVDHPDLRDRRIELVDGRLVEKGEPPHMVSNKRNSELAVEISSLIRNANAEYSPRIGRVTGADGGYVLFDGRVRQPDVGFIRRERAGGDSAVVYHGAPDLAVEVISPSESQTAVLEKVEAYLASGGTLVWTVYADSKMIVAYQQGTDGVVMHIHRVGDTLAAPDVLPNLSIDLAALFAVLDD